MKKKRKMRTRRTMRGAVNRGRDNSINLIMVNDLLGPNEQVPSEDNELVPFEDSVHVPFEDSVHVPFENNEHVSSEDNEHVPFEDREYVPFEDNEHVPSEDNEQAPSENDNGSSQPEVETLEANSRKRKRMYRPHGRPTFGDHHKEVMEFNELGQPVGPRLTVTKFGRYLGWLSRDSSLFPVNTRDWRTFKNSSNIEEAWTRVKERLDWSDPEMVKREKEIKNVVLEKLDDRWRRWKAFLRRQHYLPLEGMEDRWKCGEGSIDESQWKGLVNMWEDVRGKKRSEINKMNRKRRKTNHTTGRVTFAEVRYDYKLREGHDPDRVTFFKMTHTRKDGQVVNEASKEIFDDFEKREEEIRKRGEEVTAEVRNELFAAVMGPEKCGRVRGYGIGVTWDQVPGIVIAHNGKMSLEMQSLREELEQQRENALNAQKEMERMKAEALEREQRIRDEAAAREARMRREQEELAAKMKQMDADIEKRVTDKMAEMMRLFAPALLGALQQASTSAVNLTK